MKILKGALHGEVWTFTQFFRHKNYDRYRELKECLKKNCECPHIDKIVLLNEKDYSDEWKKMKGSEKIQQVIIGRRLAYSDFLKYVLDLNKLLRFYRNKIFYIFLINIVLTFP
jgi:hypothetical protein